ncbi:MAG: alpha/beta hydrolase [Phycisphaerae bacterium]|nr:alpha/beta hydrolase [Phycisphaerae bacterium]
MTRLPRWTVGLAWLVWLVSQAGVAAANAQPISVVADIAYKSGDGLTAYEMERCKLDLYLPEGEKGFATLLWFHGGGITEGSKSDPMTVGIAKWFSGQGVAVALPNYRLSPAAAFPAYLDDAAASVAWLHRNVGAHGGDAKRIFVCGHSAGGYLTAMIGLDGRYLGRYGLSPDVVAGLIPVSGQMVTHSAVRAERRIGRTRQIVDEAAPLYHVRADAPPAVCICGSEDLPARAEENRLFVAAMKAAGHERIEYLEVEGRDHGTIVSRISEPDDVVARAILAFVKTGRSSRVYYVDDVHGDDGRDGRSRVAAWRSLEKVNQASLKPGDTVLFRRGGLWRGQLVPQSGAPGLPITYGAYGMGDKPSLLGSVAMDAAAEWSLVEDGIWSTTDSQGPLAVDVGNIIFDHGAAVGVKKWSRAELQRPWDYFYDSNGKRVLLRSDGNPASLHRSIELALRKHIIDQSGKRYVTYEDLDLRYGAAHGIGGSAVRHIIVRRCDLSYIGGGHQHTTADGRPVRYGNGIEFWSSAGDCLVEDCRLWEIYDAALTNQGSGTNVQENITYRRNVIWNCEYSFEYWNRDESSRTHNIRFEHNTCVDAGYGWGHAQRPDRNGRHLMFYDNTAGTSDFVVRYNIFCNATDSCLRLAGRDWTVALTMDANCWFQPEGLPLLLWGRTSVGVTEFAEHQRTREFSTHALVMEPEFVDAAARDYRLAPDSPAGRLQDNGIPVGALP